MKRWLITKFECDCIACVKNYSLFEELERKDLNYSMRFANTSTVRDAVSQFKKYAQYIEKNFKRHLSLETTLAMGMLHDCINEISKIRMD